MAQPLTSKQQLFCNEYAVDMNGTQAAIRAGYSAKTAEQQSSRLLSNVKVSICINKLLAERHKEAEITSELILDALWTNHMLSLDRGETAQSNRALELLGKSHRLFIDRVEQTVTVYEEMSDTELDQAIKQAQTDIDSHDISKSSVH